jgi:hypothetical protein
MGKEPKAVIIADCPIVGALFFCWLSKSDDQLGAQLDAQLGDQLDAQLLAQLRAKLRAQLRDQLHAQLRDQLDAQLDAQLGAQLDDQLDAQLDAQLRDQLDAQLDDQLRAQRYVSLWWRTWSAWYEGAKALGVEFDIEKFELFKRWTTHVPVIYTNEAIPIVSRWPMSVNWKGSYLHNEQGMAVQFRSGWGLWMLDGQPVDEQIVMRPETQTIKQIDAEGNSSVRNIRIERFGFSRYLSEGGGRLLKEVKRGPARGKLFVLKEQSKHFLMQAEGREVSIEVPNEIETCQQAHQYYLDKIMGADDRKE